MGNKRERVLSFDLNDKVALVTGAGRGIGAAIAFALAARGACIILADLTVSATNDTRTAIAESGGRAFSVACDMRNEPEVASAVSDALSLADHIDILVNNAGIHRGHPPLEFPQSDIDLLIQTNLLGCFYACRAVGRHMIEQRSGSIINISALGGGIAGLGRGGSIYGATKGALVSLTRDLAAEWAKYGIRVNAVAPGWIRSVMTEKLQNNTSMADRMLARVPMARWGTAEDIAGPVAFLASDASSYITGQVIAVDGGASTTIPISTEA
jgi:NAD(P)-dependent dehydrogenase (short-subunit alcohol dehydrogenase family)